MLWKYYIIYKNKQSTNINIKDIIEEIKNLSEKDVIDTIRNYEIYQNLRK